MKIPLTVIILTYNEAKNLPTVLQSLNEFVDEIFIVDSYSTDQTVEIAKSYGSNVVQHKFETHTKQWIFALNNLTIANNWILGLDADQQITTELVKELMNLFQTGNPSHSGYYIKRRMYFLGKWIRHGGYYPRYLLKLFRKDSVYLDEGELMDHHFYVNGSTAKLQYDLIEDNKNETLSFWLAKHIRYASLQAKEEIDKARQLQTANADLFGNQDERRQWLKKLWERFPLFIRPLLYFFYRYFIQLGFLDGKQGLIFHFLQACWYRFIVDAMIYEQEKSKIKDKIKSAPKQL
ncbi:glycosyltransferase family 2 protein [Rhodocytophaga aerolata]|uniref:Glycosyltransferase family 2 protein n=1 Tax=Rhodocytophaga aerolata TaxID=455078 RepID=A0ABT8RCH8_9BACT|nr:glycosyltransferase family 2 protein [Rhodocytophaga aerolata]MDO1449804.1 glycosyltransferase family 2 protein [Rhodocytophaga aerolata]